MLVTKQCDIGRNNWSSFKPESFKYSPESIRMSNFEPLTRLPDWRGQYPQYPPQEEIDQASSQIERPSNTQNTGNAVIQPSPAVMQALGHRHSFAHLSHGQEISQAPQVERPESAPGDCRNTTPGESQNSSVVPLEITSSSRQAISSTNTNTSPTLRIKTETSNNLNSHLEHVSFKEEELEEDLDGDEDEDDEVIGDGAGGLTETEAQRRAERRKMKRFRLTHQQTRFLMSEFAKQAHPDAAHRERLSREIPGLSPRQVQVWFQNRRAKIKRLTADDRERMMKMRAVPDDFDNVQALHSPYGAVQGINTPMMSPVDYSSSSFGDHSMMRPLLVDTLRRQDLDEHISPTALTGGFNHGFNPSGPMASPDVLSPLSMASSDRYYPSHLTSPMSGPRSANPFLRQNSSDGYQIHPQSRQDSRSSQPLRLRETVSRARSESLQSPLRSSMSWKGDSLDYGNYQAHPSSPTFTGRQQSMYHPEQQAINQTSQPGYESVSYSSSAIHASSSHNIYANPQQSVQPSVPAVPRFRSASSAYSPGLEVRTQYRTLPSQTTSHGLPTTPRHSSFAGPFNSSGFSSAPLSAPTDFQLPRASGDMPSRDYTTPQLSAPMAPPQDFSSAYSQNMSPSRLSHNRGEDDRPFPPHPTQSAAANVQEQEQGQSEHIGFVRDGYELAQSGHKRKRTYSMPGQYMP